MQLKDLVLSTIDELSTEVSPDNKLRDDEIKFLKHSKERLSTLFEALQAPNSKKYEIKLNLVLDYLEHSLKSIDDRLKKLSDADNNK